MSSDSTRAAFAGAIGGAAVAALLMVFAFGGAETPAESPRQLADRLANARTHDAGVPVEVDEEAIAAARTHSARDAVRSEHRNEAWAGQTEVSLSSRLSGRLESGGGRVTNLACGSQTCVLSVTSPDEPTAMALQPYVLDLLMALAVDNCEFGVEAFDGAADGSVSGHYYLHCIAGDETPNFENFDRRVARDEAARPVGEVTQ